MGQATLDLPDPPLPGVDAGPLSPQALASADDLLSQLAGDDIDRLLAEADTERPPAPAPPPTPPAPAPAAVAADSTPPLATAAQKASDASTADAVTAAAIDAVLAPAIQATVQAVETPPTPAEPAPVADTTLPQSTFEPVDQKLLDEAAAQVASIMAPPAPAPQADSAPSSVADSAEREALSEPLILPEEDAALSKWLWPLVKILELINAPMKFFSDEVRQGMGRIALVTTFNAAAVLVYVILFRRGHH